MTKTDCIRAILNENPEAKGLEISRLAWEKFRRRITRKYADNVRHLLLKAGQVQTYQPEPDGVTLDDVRLVKSLVERLGGDAVRLVEAVAS